MPHATACAPAFNASWAPAESAIPPAATTGNASAAVDLPDQRQQGRLSLHVASRLHSLGYHAARADGGSNLRLFRVTYLHENEHAGRACPSNEVRVGSPREGDDRNALREHEFEALALIEREYEVDAERVGQSPTESP